MSTSLRDAWTRERYLLQFSWAMQDYPKNAAIKRELRTELTATAAEVGMRQAVADLGHPRLLAEGYIAELGRRVPRWTTGAVWGTLALCAMVYLVLAYSAGTLDTLAQLGGGTVERVFLGATTTYTHTADAVSVGSTLTWQVAVFYLAVFTIPYLLGARVWRAWTTTPAPTRAARA